MISQRARLAIVVGLGLVLAWAAAADAQEWKIYLKGKVEPIVANYYAEEAPWVFYQDDESMYTFALGCNRIDRVERGGAPIPAPACPVDALPTTTPRILVNIMDLESKRLDDGIAKLREQTRAYADAVVGSVVAARGLLVAGGSESQAEQQLRQDVGAVSFLRNQIEDTLFDIRLTERRVGALTEAAKGFPKPARARYFFAPR
jgi:hypothetical protein